MNSLVKDLPDFVGRYDSRDLCRREDMDFKRLYRAVLNLYPGPLQPWGEFVQDQICRYLNK